MADPRANFQVLFSLLREQNFCYFPRFVQKPEDQAREKIDALLQQCGWILQNRSTINLSTGRGIAIREGLLKGGEASFLSSSRRSFRSLKRKPNATPSGYLRTLTDVRPKKTKRISLSR